jgi:hypothetical protein
VFNETQVKIDLGLLEGEMSSFASMANRMHEHTVKKMSTAAKWYAELLTDRTDLTNDEVIEMGNESRVLRTLLQVFREAPGAEPTAWGLVNGTTAFVDFIRGRTPESGLNSAWFGAGATLKEKAWQKGVETVKA